MNAHDKDHRGYCSRCGVELNTGGRFVRTFDDLKRLVWWCQTCFLRDNPESAMQDTANTWTKDRPGGKE